MKALRAVSITRAYATRPPSAWPISIKAAGPKATSSISSREQAGGGSRLLFRRASVEVGQGELRGGTTRGAIVEWIRFSREEKGMCERERNQRVADSICRDFKWQGREFRIGECAALLDGAVVAVATDIDQALDAFRTIEPDPRRGMLVEVSQPVIDVIR